MVMISSEVTARMAMPMAISAGNVKLRRARMSAKRTRFHHALSIALMIRGSQSS